MTARPGSARRRPAAGAHRAEADFRRGLRERSRRTGPPRLGPGIALALAFLAVVDAAAAPPELLDPPPPPAVEILEPAAREQLEEQQQALAAALDAGAPDAERLAREYGRLGELYLLYEFYEAAEPCLLNASRLEPRAMRWHYLLGDLYTAEGSLEEAIRSLERARELRPDDVPTLLRLGNLHLELGDAPAAAPFFAAAAGLAPGAAAEYGLGRVAYAEGRFEDAAGHFETALRLQPAAAVVHYLLGRSYQEIGRREEAARHLRLSRPGHVAFPDPLLAELAALARGAHVHLRRGNEALRRGDLPAAAASFRRAVEEDPRNSTARYNLGLALGKLGEPERAVAELEAALALDPDYRDAHVNLAALLLERGDAARAAHHLGRAVEIDPEDEAARVEWAWALGLAGEVERGRRMLEEAVARRASSSEAWLRLAALRARAADLDGARLAYERVLALAGDGEEQALAHLGLARLAEAAGEWAAAEAGYRQALERRPDDRDAARGLARLLGRAGRYAESAELYDALVAAAPEDLEAHFGRAMALLLAGEDGRARAALEASTAALPASRPLRHALARLLATSPDAALRDGARALELARGVFAAEQTLEHAETVAMALAESGRFDEAVDWQQRIVGELERRGDGPGAELARQRVELYRAGRPVRSPWREGGG